MVITDFVFMGIIKLREIVSSCQSLKETNKKAKSPLPCKRLNPQATNSSRCAPKSQDVFYRIVYTKTFL